MRVLITGATGFIGHHILSRLLDAGVDVVVTGRKKPLINKSFRFICADLLVADLDQLVKQAEASHLLHLAWYAEHGKYWESTQNVDWASATERLAQSFCTLGGQRIVAAGTCAEYDASYGYCNETLTPSNPSTLYGIAKNSTRLMVEKICKINDVSFAWGRIFIPFGLHENKNRLIPSVVDGLTSRRPPFAINMHHWRDLLPVEEVAEAFLFLLKSDSHGTFNICSGHPIEIEDVVRRLALWLQKDPEPFLSRATERTGKSNFLIGDNNLLLSEGWTLKYKMWDNLQAYANILSNKLSRSKLRGITI